MSQIINHETKSVIYELMCLNNSKIEYHQTITNSFEDDLSKIFKENGQTKFEKNSIDILKEWLILHQENPYPRIKEKEALQKETGLTKKQLNCCKSIFI